MTTVEQSPALVEEAWTEGAPRRHPWAIPAALGSAVVAATVYTSVLDPNTSHAFPLCPLKYFTGADCPACGCLRSVHSLTHGRLLEAADHNLLFVALVPLVVVGYLSWLARSVGIEVPRMRLSGRAIGVMIAVVIAFGIVRNLPIPGHDFLFSSA